MKIEEKISLTCGRDGGLQNMELHGMIMLHISDEKFARIRLHVENEDKRGVQLQVKPIWSPMLLNMFLLLSSGKIMDILKCLAVLCSHLSLLSKYIGNGSSQCKYQQKCRASHAQGIEVHWRNAILVTVLPSEPYLPSSAPWHAR